MARATVNVFRLQVEGKENISFSFCDDCLNIGEEDGKWYRESMLIGAIKLATVIKARLPLYANTARRRYHWTRRGQYILFGKTKSEIRTLIYPKCGEETV